MLKFMIVCFYEFGIYRAKYNAYNEINAGSWNNRK